MADALNLQYQGGANYLSPIPEALKKDRNGRRKQALDIGSGVVGLQELRAVTDNVL